MFLADTTVKAVERWRGGLSPNPGYVTQLVPWLLAHCSACFINGDDNKVMGYCLFTGATPDPKYSNVLVEAVAGDSYKDQLPRLVPNLMRSLQLDSALARTDDTDFTRLLFHYHSEYYHLIQLYEAPETVAYDLPGITLTKTTDMKRYRKLAAQGEFCSLAPDIFDAESDNDLYEAVSGRKKLGFVAVQREKANSRSRLFVYVNPNAHRQKYGVAMTIQAGALIRAEGRQPVLAIKPEDETAYSFVTHIHAQPILDLIRINPSFHLRPVEQT